MRKGFSMLALEHYGAFLLAIVVVAFILIVVGLVLSGSGEQNDLLDLFG